ncbi:hypothetical protein FF1_013099 [Malus domestica]
MDHLASLLLLLSLLSSALTSSTVPNDVDPFIQQVISEFDNDQLLHAERHFSSSKATFGKSYTTQEEHNYRVGVFKANLRRAKRHQALDLTAVHCVTKFSDLTPKEFRRNFFGLKCRLRLLADTNKAPILPTGDLPADFDWRNKGVVTSVKDQTSLIMIEDQRQITHLDNFPEKALETDDSQIPIVIPSIRVAKKLSRKKSERFTYLVATVMSSFGITSMAIMAVYYRFYWQMEDGNVPMSKMLGTFALSVGAAHLDFQ